MQRLPAGDWHVATGDSERVVVRVSTETWEAWRREGLPWIDRVERTRTRPFQAMFADGGYHSVDQVEQSLRSLVETFPAITRLVDVGESVEGRRLWAVVLTDRPGERSASLGMWPVSTSKMKRLRDC